MSGQDRFARLVVKTQTDILGGPHYGTAYNLEKACPSCGTGATPIGPRYLKMKQFSKQPVFQTLDGEIIFSSKVAESLGSTGSSFLADVRDASSQQPLPFYELRYEAELPPFSTNTTGFEKERACERCHRDGHFEIPNIPLRVVYPRLHDELKSKNVLATFERFGNSRRRTPIEDSVYARPLFIVSDRLAATIEEMELPGIVLEYIQFECVPGTSGTGRR